MKMIPITEGRADEYGLMIISPRALELFMAALARIERKKIKKGRRK